VNYRDGFSPSRTMGISSTPDAPEAAGAQGSIFQSTMDTEVVVHLIAAEREPSATAPSSKQGSTS
jgi:hypothetical protein